MFPLMYSKMHHAWQNVSYNLKYNKYGIMYHIWWNKICAVKWDMKVSSDNMDNNYNMLLK